jgi:hypothetical protein
MSQPIDYTMRYQIRAGRVNFANYVVRKQQVQDGTLLGLQLYPPDNDASIVPIIKEGAEFTTQAEYDRYIASVVSTTASAPISSATLPGVPTSLSAAGGVREVTISFTPGSDGGSPITNYEYYPVDASGAAWTPFSPSVTSSPVVVPSLPNNMTLQFKIRAVNAVGSGAESTIVAGTTFAIPAAPTSLSATSGNGQVTISFTAGSNGGTAITNYKYSTDNGTTYTEFSPADTDSPVTITGLTNGTPYQIKLRAVSAVGDGTESSAVTATPSNDAIINSLTTSLAAYTAAATDDWVPITSSEYTALQTNVTGTVKAGTTDPVLSATYGGGLANAKAALVANSVTSISPAILANQYLYGFAFRWGTSEGGVNLRVYTNTASGSTSGFNQVGSILPNQTNAGLYYYVRKGVSTTNGATAGLLSVFTGTKMDYSNPNFTGSAGYIAFNNSLTPKPAMQYLLTDGTVPPSNSTLTGSLAGYGIFVLQGLTTATKQWA